MRCVRGQHHSQQLIILSSLSGEEEAAVTRAEGAGEGAELPQPARWHGKMFRVKSYIFTK